MAGAGSWVGLRLRSGQLVRVRYGGLVAAPVFEQFAPPGSAAGWTMGPLEDLLWARLPALRLSLAESMARELERAVEMDRVLWGLSTYEACSILMHELFRPALDGLPGTVEAARVCCRVLREVVALDEVLGCLYGDALHHRVFGWLHDTYPSQLSTVDPQLSGLVKAWFEAPEPPPGPAVVVGGPGADQGGNPLGVSPDEVGWAWVDVDAGADRVAVVRYGGVASWALLNVAPEPVEEPMDLGLGPLADLVWAGLPAARAALVELALAELDAAVLDDRVPVAVPGTAVTALLPPLIRHVLDRPQDRLARPAETVGRCVRMLARLVQVDAGLAGRHRGGVAEALGWLRVEPYRSQVAGVDPGLLARL